LAGFEEFDGVLAAGELGFLAIVEGFVGVADALFDELECLAGVGFGVDELEDLAEGFEGLIEGGVGGGAGGELGEGAGESLAEVGEFEEVDF